MWLITTIVPLVDSFHRLVVSCRWERESWGILTNFTILSCVMRTNSLFCILNPPWWPSWVCWSWRLWPMMPTLGSDSNHLVICTYSTMVCMEYSNRPSTPLERRAQLCSLQMWLWVILHLSRDAFQDAVQQRSLFSPLIISCAMRYAELHIRVIKIPRL